MRKSKAIYAGEDACEKMWLNATDLIDVSKIFKNVDDISSDVFLACDVFVRTNRRTMMRRRAIALPRCSSVCLSETGVHCDRTVYVSTDSSLWLDSPMFWAI